MVIAKCPICTYATDDLDVQIAIQLLRMHGQLHDQTKAPAQLPQQQEYQRMQPLAHNQPQAPAQPHQQHESLMMQPLAHSQPQTPALPHQQLGPPMKVGGFQPQQQQTMSTPQKMFLVISMGVAGIGWLLHVIGLSTNHWFGGSFEFAGFSILSFAGLFVCNPNCGASMTATQACVIIGILAASAGILLIIVSLALNGKMPRLPFAAGGACVLGAFFTTIGVIVFLVDLGFSRVDWSFYLTAVGGFIYFVAGGLAIVSKCFGARR